MGESKNLQKGSESSSTTAQGGRDWTKLPDDVTASILLLADLEAFDILIKYQMVCKTWHRVFCNYRALWHTIDMRSWDLFVHHRDWKDVEKMCRNAIDRSSGQLVDISCVYGSNDLLKYVGDRCNGIKRLRLHCCSGIIDDVSNQVASKFPLLEGLHLFKLDRCSLSPKTLELIGRSCPLLKSFKWYKIRCKSTVRDGQDDDYAKAIAGTMRGLQHLSLSWLNLTNNALKEILDYCPHLESLDLGYVFVEGFGSVRGDLEKRMKEKIKNLQLPFQVLKAHPNFLFI